MCIPQTQFRRVSILVEVVRELMRLVTVRRWDGRTKSARQDSSIPFPVDKVSYVLVALPVWLLASATNAATRQRRRKLLSEHLLFITVPYSVLQCCDVVESRWWCAHLPPAAVESSQLISRKHTKSFSLTHSHELPVEMFCTARGFLCGQHDIVTA